jgi:hypothetical protein
MELSGRERELSFAHLNLIGVKPIRDGNLASISSYVLGRPGRIHFRQAGWFADTRRFKSFSLRGWHEASAASRPQVTSSVLSSEAPRQ